MFGMTEPYFGRRIAILGVVAPVRVLVKEPVPSVFMSNADGNSYVVGFWFLKFSRPFVCEGFIVVKILAFRVKIRAPFIPGMEFQNRVNFCVTMDTPLSKRSTWTVYSMISACAKIGHNESFWEDL